MSKIKAKCGYGYTEYAEKCDKCGEQSRTTHEHWTELNRINKTVGWVFEFDKGEWKGYCPKCSGSGNIHDNKDLLEEDRE